MGDHFADAAIEALDYWVIVNDDGELELTKDAMDDAGGPLTFGQRIRKGNLPTTEVKDSSFESVFSKKCSTSCWLCDQKMSEIGFRISKSRQRVE